MKNLILFILASAVTSSAFTQVHKDCVFNLVSKNKKLQRKAYTEALKFAPSFVASANGSDDISMSPFTEPGFTGYFKNRLKNIPVCDSVLFRIREGSASSPEEEAKGVLIYTVLFFKKGAQIRFISFVWIGDELTSAVDTEVKRE